MLFLLLIVLLPLPSLKAQHRSNSKHTAHNEIVALEHQWRTAQLANDVVTMDKLLSDDYLGITSEGDVLTKAQQLDRMRTRALSITSLDFSDLNIKLRGQVAIVTSLAHVQGLNDSHPLDGSYRYTRIYQHLPNDGWKITNFEITRIRGSHPPGAASLPEGSAPANVPPTS
jgi:ketosteroid isomerase-like protein